VSLVRHFTATGFVVQSGHTLLHWHPKVRAWLPPGGHVADGEDPVQAVLREVLEETGLAVEVVSTGVDARFDYPRQVAPPLTILIEDIDDPVTGLHQHIDMIYVCRPLAQGAPAAAGWLWVSRADLEAATPVSPPAGAPPAPTPAPPPEDVRVLAMHAFAVEDRAARLAERQP